MTIHPHLPMIIDSFAGGGGASTGIEIALGRSPDVAINHSADALSLHGANHPETLHLDSNIWDVDPLAVTKGRHVGLLWASPDCKHFSKAKGGAPRDRNIRDLAWVVVRWAEFAKPDVICMENVEEFVTWGPIDNDGQPIKEFAGQTFDLWIKRLRRAGYRVQWRELRACDYGAPTIRKRWFLIARRDGRPIVWPKPTHGNPASAEVRKGKLLPWVGADTCIDWSLPCPSIFDSKAEVLAKHGLRAVRPLAENTLARVARGMKRYVIDAERPFLVNTTGHSGYGEHDPVPTITTGGHHAVIAPVLTYAQQGGGNRAAADPHHTICASRKDQNSLIAASLMRTDMTSAVKRNGIYHMDEPLRTAMTSQSFALMATTMVQIGYGERKGQQPRALNLGQPLGTVVAGGAKHAPIAAFLAQQNGGPRMGGHAGHDPRDPISTIAASGSHQTPVAAFFAKYYGTGDGARTDDPMHTVTVKDRMAHMQAELAAPPFAPEHHARARTVAEFLRAHDAWNGGEFVTIEGGGATFIVIDIGMRMLTPRELFRAQGFPDDYVIEGVWEGLDTDSPVWVPFAKDVQVSCCGNSVCPPLAAAIVGANCGHLSGVCRGEARA